MSSPQRREPGIRRRLRLWFVRRTLWEKDHPVPGRKVTYGHPWRSRNELAKCSLASSPGYNLRYRRERDRTVCE